MAVPALPGKRWVGSTLSFESSIEVGRIMKNITLVGWLGVAALVAWFAYNHTQTKPLEDCQQYDSLGRGIGCEGADLADM